nr:hypothetical protein [candidate division Zixibacteria bacterium]
MNRLVSIILCALMIPVAVQSAENSLKAGSWSFQFEANRDLELTAFQGSTISCKKHTSDGAAWRLGLSTDIEFREDENSRNRIDTTIGQTNNDMDDYSFVLHIQRVFYPRPDAKINFYWGFGPDFGYGRYKRKYTSENPLSGWWNKQTGVSTTYSFGMSGILGVEWFVWSNISFLAEYGSTLMYTHAKYTSELTANGGYFQADERKTTSFGFDGDEVRFGISVYF